MHSSDGTSTMIEQVKTNPSNLGLSSNTAFEFKGNTPSVLPVPEPYTLTFTPMVSQSKSGPAIPPMSYDVLASGKLQWRGVPLRLKDDDHEGKKQSFCVSPSAEPRPVTLSTRGKSTERAPTPEFPVPIASAVSVGTIPVAQTSKCKGKSKERFKSSKMSARTPTKPQMLPSNAAARASIPFPSMGPASGSDPPAAVLLAFPPEWLVIRPHQHQMSQRTIHSPSTIFLPILMPPMDGPLQAARLASSAHMPLRTSLTQRYFGMTRGGRGRRKVRIPKSRADHTLRRLIRKGR
jgi:hypothetical protein